MRALGRHLLLLAALVVAGCSSPAASPDEVPGQGSPSQPQPTSAPGEPPVTSTPPRPAPTPASFEPVNARHDHTDGEAETITFVVPEGGLMLRYHIRFEAPADRPCASAPTGGPTMRLLRPDGEVEAASSMEGGIALATQACTGDEAMKDAHLVAGTWTIEFAGRGFAIGSVDVTQP